MKIMIEKMLIEDSPNTFILDEFQKYLGDDHQISCMDEYATELPIVKSFDLFILHEYLCRWWPRQIVQYALNGETSTLHTSKGFIPGTFFLEPYGLFSECYLYPKINELLSNYEIDDRIQKGVKKVKRIILDNNYNYYDQSKDCYKINKEYVLLPLQYSKDLCLVYASKIKNQAYYEDFIYEVAKFCYENQLILAVKKHPHATQKEEEAFFQEQMINSLISKYGDLVCEVSGNINLLCQNSLFVASVNGTVVMNCLLTNSIISTCGDSLIKESGAIIYDEDISHSLERAYKLSSQAKEGFHNRQNAMIYCLFHDIWLCDKRFPEFYHMNKEKILNRVILSLSNQKKRNEFKNVKKEDLPDNFNFGNFNHSLTVPKGIPTYENISGYRNVIIKENDTLNALFGSDWEKIYNLDVNMEFRTMFPNPNYIFPGYVIRVPLNKKVET